MCALCDGQSIEDYVDAVTGLIDRHGWALQYVDSALVPDFEHHRDADRAHADDAEVVPAFCYTVGLTSHEHPELVVTGRNPGESAAILNVLARRILFDRERFEAGDECAVAGFRVSFVDVTESREWLLMAARMYPNDELHAVQAVWRDSDGFLPWEGPMPSTIVQPVLGPPPGWYGDGS